MCLISTVGLFQPEKVVVTMSFFHKSKESGKVILAPQTGKIVPLSEVPDPVFSGKVLGDGAAILPAENKVFAPISGTIVQVADTLHAVCIESEDGLDILLHLGLDTVKLKGKGFRCHVRSGQHVAAGDLLMEMDLDYIQRAGYPVVTPCIITNLDAVKKVSAASGDAVAGKTILIKYER
jgi:glucose-specific phosphotransferase system IIA component